MNQRGRKSNAALAVVPDDEAVGPLRAPPSLTPAERLVWQATVGSKPVDWFGIEHVPILVEYCRHVCRGHVIDEQIRGFDKEWLATDEGLRRYDRLSAMANKTATVIKTLATCMRLTHHSVYRKSSAVLDESPKRRIWQREPS